MLSRIALGVGAVLLAVLLGEVMVRLLGVEPVAVNPDQRSLWVYDEVLGWASRPSHTGVLDNGFFRTPVRTNARGLRGPERPYAKPSDRTRVLILGDSFAWGFGVEDDETVAARLETQRPGTEVVNGGVSGYSTDQSLLWLRREGVRYEPDEVILILSGNDDIMNHMQVAYWIYYKPTFQIAPDGTLRLRGVPVPRMGLRERLCHGVRSRSALAKSIEMAWFGQEAPFVYLADALPDPTDPHRLTVALIDAMRDEARKIGAHFRIVADSSYWFSPEGSLARLIGELRGQGHDVLLVDEASGWDPETMRIPGDGHWNARGHAFVAALLSGRNGGPTEAAGQGAP